jgi:hypothetical protein
MFELHALLVPQVVAGVAAGVLAFTRSAISFCSGVCGKMAERYWVPTSFPWRLSVVGSCSRNNHFSSRSS